MFVVVVGTTWITDDDGWVGFMSQQPRSINKVENDGEVFFIIGVGKS
jgi:hypothetical protein